MNWPRPYHPPTNLYNSQQRQKIMGVFNMFRRSERRGTDPGSSFGMSEAGAKEDTAPFTQMPDEGFTEFGPSQFGDSLASPLSAHGSDDAAVERSGQQEQRARRRVNARPGTRVLIIDESAAVVSGLRRMMRQNQLDPIEALGGQRGLELAFSARPELIFLAVAMPGMSGFNVLRSLRRDERTRDVPVIMMSGNAQATEADYVRRMGADDFMTKPFSRADVFLRIERLLDPDLMPRRPTEPAPLS
ncbi:MAG: response regulator [Burkholderiales bacterium]